MKIYEKKDFKEVVEESKKRTSRIGAKDENEMIYLLEKEIYMYRKIIMQLKNDLKERTTNTLKNDENLRILECEVGQLPNITINIENMTNTFYPESFLKG